MTLVLTNVCGLRLRHKRFWFFCLISLYVVYRSEVTHHDTVGSIPVFIIEKMGCYSNMRLYIL